MSDTSAFVTTALLEEKALSAEGAAKARAIAAERGVQLDEALVGIEGITAEKIAITRATIAEVPFVRLSDYTVDVANARLLPRSLAERHRVFPLFVIGQVATLAMVDPLDLLLLDRVRQSLQCELEPVACEPAALGDLISRAYSMALEEGLGEAGAEASVESLLSGEEPIVAAVNQILAQAVAENASDVHISPDEHELQLRFRIDGDLHRRPGPPKSSHSGLVQRIKVMARMDLTQTRLPQDGKFRFTSRHRAVDVRASVLPTIHGENVVLRILATGAAIKGFAELGLSPNAAERIERVISHPHGMLLVTGPTGSGKTTTLYTALKRLNTPDANVMTIEDPVEIRLPMVRHVQVHAEAGMTFAGTLRAVLRQDPDVVLVGDRRCTPTTPRGPSPGCATSGAPPSRLTPGCWACLPRGWSPVRARRVRCPALLPTRPSPSSASNPENVASCRARAARCAAVRARRAGWRCSNSSKSPARSEPSSTREPALTACGSRRSGPG